MRITGIKYFFFLLPLVYVSFDNGAYSEEYMYNFGLNAPKEVYEYVDLNLSDSNCLLLSSQLDTFPVVTVAIDVNDSIITKCDVTSISQTKEISSMIESVFIHKKVDFDFINDSRRFYDFRIHLDSLCGLK